MNLKLLRQNGSAGKDPTMLSWDTANAKSMTHSGISFSMTNFWRPTNTALWSTSVMRYGAAVTLEYLLILRTTVRSEFHVAKRSVIVT
jgi:hypothetical protein